MPKFWERLNSIHLAAYNILKCIYTACDHVCRLHTYSSIHVHMYVSSLNTIKLTCAPKVSKQLYVALHASNIQIRGARVFTFPLYCIKQKFKNITIACLYCK